MRKIYAPELYVTNKGSNLLHCTLLYAPIVKNGQTNSRIFANEGQFGQFRLIIAQIQTYIVQLKVELTLNARI